MVAQNSNRTKLLQGTACAALAAALMMPAPPASAQAFQATPNVVDGAANIDRSVTGQDTITAQTDTVVIDWSPTEDQQGNALTFLPQGNTAIYQNDLQLPTFAVLNRILPSTNGDIVVMNGTVISQIASASGPPTPGGFVAFYSPTGLLIGSTAVFDVGGLLLTTLDPDIASFNAFAGGGGSLQLTGTTGQTSGVTIQPGAQIIGTSEGSFFAVAAPFVDMAGTATINGSTAYVAGEQVSMAYSNGLFDIVVPVGTSVSSAVTHTGTTTGPASTGTGDNHVIYVVASPNQTPIQMLLNGNLGFAPAQTAGMDNGDIILSAGSNVSGRVIDLFNDNGVDASIRTENGQFSSSVNAKATTAFEAQSVVGDIAFDDGLDVFSNTSILLEATGNNDLIVTGDTLLQSDGTTVGNDVFGGTVQILAQAGSTLTLDGNLLAFTNPSQVDGAGTGGTVQIGSQGGQLEITGNAQAQANAAGYLIGGAGGDSTGGAIDVFASNGGTTTVGGSLILQALAVTPPDAGFNATGGDIDVFAETGGTVDIAGDVSLAANALGGDSLGGTGGAAQGGLARISTLGGSILVGGNVLATANATGGNGGTGGDATGGIAGVVAQTGSIAIGGNITARAIANGGDASIGFGGNGGDGLGGTAFVQADGDLTSAGSVSAGFVQVDASGYGGIGGAGENTDFIAPGQGGSGTGGTFQGQLNSGGAFVLAGADRGTLTLGDVVVVSNGIGGRGGDGAPGQAGADGGEGSGGTAQFGSYLGAGDGSVGLGSATMGTAFASASGTGGDGGTGGTTEDRSGDGGAGAGGGAYLSAATNSQVTAATADLVSSATGGSGDAGGSASAGESGVLANSAMISLTGLRADATAFGGQSLGNGPGGAALGGNAEIAATESTIDISGNLNLLASAYGGAGIVASGAADGGSARLGVAGGSFTTGGLARISANGQAGDVTGLDATAADGSGGLAEAEASAGATVELGSLQISAGGQGSSGTAAGAGTGGTVRIAASDVATSLSVLANVVQDTGDQFDFNAIASAKGIGGDLIASGVGNGGDGVGGSIEITADAGALVAFPTDNGADYLRFFARGFGGTSALEGSSGGAATGGNGLISASGGTVTMGPTVFSMYAEGGSSDDANANIAGGDAAGGTRTVLVEDGGVLNASLVGGVSGGVGGNGSGTGSGGDATGGVAQMFVDNGIANLTGHNIVVTQPTGGDGATGGSATGGLAQVIVSNGGVINVLPDGQEPGDLTVSTFARGGTGTAGAGGGATGGDAALQIIDSTYNGIATYVSADAIAGDSATTQGPDAVGGNALFQADNAQVTLTGETIVSASANGGAGGSSAFGGTAVFSAFSGSTISLASLTVATDALSGLNGGDAAGGVSQVGIFDTSTATAEQIDLTSTAEASVEAVGGSAELFVGADPESSTGGGATLETTGLSLDAGASGGETETAGTIAVNAYLGAITTATLVGSALADNAGGSNAFAAVGGDIFITSGAQVDTAGDIEIIALDGGTIGDPNPQAPSTSLSFQSQGTITTSGDNDNLISFGGGTLTLSARDLDIENGSRIGAQFVNLESLDTDHTAILGGDTDGDGYTLTQAEAERIEAGAVTFTAPVLSDVSNDTPDVLVRDLTVIGSEEDGTSFVGLFTEGIVRIEGVLAYIDAGVEDRMEIVAGEALQVVTPGGIGIVNSDGDPTGSLGIYSDNIWVADAETIDLLNGDVNFAGRNDRLSTAASGSDDPLGYLRAGSIQLGVGETLLVRNTGSTEEPGGILVGEGGLSIFAIGSSQSTNSSAIDVFAYGRQQNDDGSFVTGADFFGLVDFTFEGEGATEYTDTSEFNDCVINSGECAGGEEPQEPEEPEEVPPEINNPAVIEAPLNQAADPIASESESDAQFGSEFPGLVDTPLVTDQTVLDDPVASGGDSSIYASDGDDEDEDDDEDGDGRADDDQGGE